MNRSRMFPPRLGFAVLAAAVLLLAAWPAAPARAQSERILDFHSRVRVHKNGDMTVAETIRVFANGRRIRRGIYREFPTTYRDRRGNRVVVGFKVVSVTRDGRPEPWFTRDQANGKRVYIGHKNRFLPRGRDYTYTITYKTTRQIGFFKEFDELYWNVTGNGWDFVIERAGATVILPPGANVLRHAAYTGRFGAKGMDWRAGRDGDGNITFRTTRMLLPRAGLTIAVAWPKGIVTAPTATQKIGYFVGDNLGVIVGFVGLAILFIFYFSVWAAVGKDPAKGVVFPRFKAPDGFTPAAARFVTRMKFDNKAFATAILSMAVKGYLTIRENKKKKFTLKKAGGDESVLSRGERKVANALFKGNTEITLIQSNHAKIRKAINALKETLKTDFEIIYFLRNRKYFFIGLGITLLTVIGFVAADIDNSVVAFMGVWLSVWTIGCYFLLQRVWSSWTSGSKVASIFVAIFATPFLIGEGVGLFFLKENSSWAAVALIVGLALVNVLFSHLLKAPTREGRRVMDEIEGLKMYMGVAEKDRLDKMHPPEKTPELFEKLLPYALALGVENEWSEQFADVLKAAGTDGGRAYSPAWYHGSSWSRYGATGFADSFGSSFSSAISSSSTAPGSSSGSSGGGSSGGGGGGGGGGGW